MSMGSTGIVNITQQMMADVKNAVSDYRTRAKALQERLEGEVNGLIPSNFSGAAADGFKVFYNKNIVPANGEGLTKLLDVIDEIAQSTLDAIPGGSGLDDQLATENQK